MVECVCLCVRDEMSAILQQKEIKKRTYVIKVQIKTLFLFILFVLYCIIIFLYLALVISNDDLKNSQNRIKKKDIFKTNKEVHQNICGKKYITFKECSLFVIFKKKYSLTNIIR